MSNNQIDFMSFSGPLVLWFDGEGRDCLLCDSPEQVVDYLMSEEGAGFEIDGSRDDLIGFLNDDDHWKYDEDNRPFHWCFPLGEISWANVIVRCRHINELRIGGPE